MTGYLDSKGEGTLANFEPAAPLRRPLDDDPLQCRRGAHIACIDHLVPISLNR